MHCAVVGCGLAGLGVAHVLQERGYQIDLYDEKGIGGGASGIASGLLHPYPGKKGLRSKFADEGMAKTLALLDRAEEAIGRPVALRNGILRKNWEPAEWGDDLERVGNDILIKSGCTVYMKTYLEGLYKALGDVSLNQKKFVDDGLYDLVVYAIGKGFHEMGVEGVQYVKGQILTCKTDEKFERSVIGSGHISPLEGEGLIHVGSTYEHHAKNDKSDLEVALEYLTPRIETFYPGFKQLSVLACSAAVRVCTKGSYLPIVKKIDDRRVIFTGLGSRGLLYHALFGERVGEMISQ